MSFSATDVPRVAVGKVQFVSCGFDEAVQSVLDAGVRRQALAVRLSNAYCVALAAHDPVYADILNGPGLTFPDGAPVLWAMKTRTGYRDSERVRGPSLFLATIEASVVDGLDHFFLGSSEATLSALTANLAMRYPDLRIAGTFSPPYGSVDEEFVDMCVNQICRVGPSIVWVALGTPKQDFLLSELVSRVGVACIAVGAAFDFAAGTVREAPLWLQRIGLEWLFRLGSEPKRLWRRYLFGNIVFLYSVLRERIRGSH